MRVNKLKLIETLIENRIIEEGLIQACTFLRYPTEAVLVILDHKRELDNAVYDTVNKLYWYFILNGD